jgi:putative hydrolase of the HAD superfamily
MRRSFAGTRAVTFDVGGTMIEACPSVGHIYAEVATRHGVANVSPEELNRRFQAAFVACKPSPQTATEWAAVVDKTFEGLTAEPPSRTIFSELYERFSQASAWRIYDDVLPTLAALAARGIRLGVISNWDERLRPLLERLDLIRHFAAVAISSELGSRKPVPEIFRRAAAMLGLPSQAILHVGDSAEEDFAGAQAAGFSALLLDRNGASDKGRRIGRLIELTELLR